MKLSPDEELFLRHWIYDEVHLSAGPGPAKRLQLHHHATPADLATLIAAAIPNPVEQESIGQGPPPSEVPRWPWSDNSLSTRVHTARTALALTRSETASRAINRAGQAPPTPLQVP